MDVLHLIFGGDQSSKALSCGHERILKLLALASFEDAMNQLDALKKRNFIAADGKISVLEFENINIKFA